MRFVAKRLTRRYEDAEGWAAKTGGLLGCFAGGEVGFDEHHDADVVEQANRDEVVGDEVERV